MDNEKQGMHYAWWILISCFFIPFTVVGIVTSCAGIFFAPVCKELGLSRGAMSLYLTITYIVTAIVLPFAARMSSAGDYKNFKKYLLIAMSIYTLTFAVASWFTSIYHWYIAAVIFGITGAFCLMTPVPTLIKNWFADKVGMAMGIALASSGLGAAIFNPFGGWLITNYGWRTAYLVLGLCAFLITVPISAILIRFRPSEMGLQPYGAEKAAAVDQAAVTVKGMSARDAGKTLTFYLCVLFAGLMTMTAVIQAHIPGYTTSLGLSTMVGAYTLTVFSMCLLVGKILIGTINDAIGMIKATVIFYVLGFAGILTIIFGGMSKNTMLVYIGGGLLGMSLSITTVQPPLLVGECFGNKEYLQIYSNVAAVGLFLQAGAVALYGFIYDWTKNYAYSFEVALVFFTIAIVGCIIAKISSKKLEQFFV